MELFVSNLYSQLVILAPKFVMALVIFLGFFLVAKIVKRIVLSNTDKFKIDPSIMSMLAKILGTIINIFGAITALGTLGVNVSAVVGGLGLTGFAFGFALKDTISNILSGVMILAYRPFYIGDSIKVGGFEGVVINIDLRYTELKADEEKILIPNKKLFTDPIIVLKRID